MIGRLFKRKSTAPEAEKNQAPQQEKPSSQEAKSPAQQGGEAKKANSRRRKPKPKAKPKAPWDISQFSVEPAEGKTRFHDLNLHNDLIAWYCGSWVSILLANSSTVLTAKLGRP